MCHSKIYAQTLSPNPYFYSHWMKQPPSSSRLHMITLKRTQNTISLNHASAVFVHSIVDWRLTFTNYNDSLYVDNLDSPLLCKNIANFLI